MNISQYHIDEVMYSYHSGTAPSQQPHHSIDPLNSDSLLAVFPAVASPCHCDTDQSSCGQTPSLVGSCRLLLATLL